MDKKFLIVNFIMILLIGLLDILYMNLGGLWLKTITSLVFVVLGAINLIYIIKQKKNLKFPIILLVALFVAMVGDVVINLNFLIGAIIFAVGHIFYVIAYSFLQKFKIKDLIFVLCVFVPALLIVLFVPILDFGGITMKIVCVVYALIISFMVGKSISNYVNNRSLFNLIIMIGSILFFISDAMLLFDVFGNVFLTGILCLSTYYPGQILIAHSVYHYTGK